MIVKNVKVYREDQTFADGEIRILDGVFEKVCTGAGRGEGILAEKDETVIDGDGAYAIPGLIGGTPAIQSAVPARTVSAAAVKQKKKSPSR